LILPQQSLLSIHRDNNNLIPLILPDQIDFRGRSNYQDILPADTFISIGNEIVFFKPTEEEFQELIKIKGEKSGLYQVESDFSFYANEVKKKLEGSPMKVYFAKERIIKIIAFDSTISYLDRVNNGTNEYGFIINSTKYEPRVEFGVYNDMDILKLGGINVNGR